MRLICQRVDRGQIMRVQGKSFQDWPLQPTDYTRPLVVGAGGKTPALFATGEDGHDEVERCEAILKSCQSKG